jgi:polysaccharide deacetylase family sporulation protein PdaB
VFKKGKMFFFSAVLVVMTLAAGITQEQLQKSGGVIKNVPTTHKVVALTLDDGPHYKTTPEVLAVLREKNVKATLFLLASNVIQHPELVQQAVKEGHEIGTHAYSHTLLTKLSKQMIAEELDKADGIISKLAPKPLLFRPPGGAFNQAVLAAAHERGYTTVTWSVDPEDWKSPPVGEVVQRVLTNVKPGSIVLLHDGQYPLPTPEALKQIINQLRAQGYSFVTVSELLQYYEVRD